MDFAPLDSGNLLTKLEFIHSAPEENSRYMVRTYGLKQVYAGTFYTFSQGAFTAVNAATENDLSQDMSIHTRRLQPSEERQDICPYRRSRVRRTDL
jgi:hypothetical protein